MQAISASGASRVIVTHGQIPTMVRWLQQNGLDAGAFDTEYGAEEEPEDLPAVAALDAPDAPAPAPSAADPSNA